MTEHLSPDSPDHEGNGRRAAHERLSTAALARWARACATHPWRVIVSSIGAIVLLAFAVGAFGGSLKDEFEIPGSDTQKATDLIESEFASEQGGVLNLVFAARRASASTLPSARPRSRLRSQRSRRRSSSRPAPTRMARRGSRASANRSTTTRSPTTGASHTPRPSSTGSSTRRTASGWWPFRRPSARRSRPPASRRSSTATPSSRRSSRGRRSCSACSRR